MRALHRLVAVSGTALVGILLLHALPAGAAAVPVLTSPGASPRELFGAGRLRAAVAAIAAPAGARIVAGVRTAPGMRRFHLPELSPHAQEAFLIRQVGSTWVVAGSDPSGVLYGELELAGRVRAAHALPAGVDDMEQPALRLRGVCIGMQKPEITYDGAEYDYPYTPENFPFFYDRAQWTRYLDMLAEERINSLYLWNGHPFTSLLRLPRYPEARELPDAQLEQNIATFRWITEEADRRGIRVLQGFYNIHLSHAFARAHHLPYHLSAPGEPAASYTRYVISEFVHEYPHAGLMMTLGEALSPHYGAEWLSRVVLPGVRDGLRESGSTVEPPIVVRAHATDIDAVLKEAAPLYPNIDTMFKWNGESLTWTNVRGPVLDRFRMLAGSSKVAIANIHLLSNLEPFRWGDPEYVRQTVASFERIGIGGLHLYPLRYWDWPVSGDNVNPPLRQIDRDWIWYESWARYAWNPNRDPEREHAYWSARLAERYGTAEAGERLLAAYTLAGPCQPRLLPRIGITEGNREAFALGMTMPQLIDPERFNPPATLWSGDAPPGERLRDYVAREVARQRHEGETPVEVADEVAEAAGKAVEQAESARPYVTAEAEEYARLVNDLRSISWLMRFYRARTHAAVEVLTYGYDRDPGHLDRAHALLGESVEDFRELTRIADPAYRTATGMQTSQRQIPFRGGMSQYPGWRQCLPMYERELATFDRRRAQLAAGGRITDERPVQPLAQVGFTLGSGAGEAFTVEEGAGLFQSRDLAITGLAPELAGMRGVRIDPARGGTVHLDLAAPAQILVGFTPGTGRRDSVLDPETEQWNLVLLNAVTARKTSPMGVWAKPLPAGPNDLDLGRGSYVILGFIPQDLHLAPRVNLAAAAPGQVNLDWLFE